MNHYRLPPALKEGDILSLIAPASPVLDKEALERGATFLRKLGFTVRESGHLQDRYYLYAGNDGTRAQEVNENFSDPSVSAIFCARGGAGSLGVVPLLDYRSIGRNPKVFVGYSDTTAIQLALLKRSGLITFYGPMVETDLARGLAEGRKEQMMALLTGQEACIEPGGPGSEEVITLSPGVASGRLVGGCLSIFVSLLGTPWEPDTTDAILFLEDIDESPHRIDRYLTQLLLAGKFQGVRGVLFGPFARHAYPPGHEYHRYDVSLPDLIRERMAPLGVPCLYGLPFGHVREPYTIPLGGLARLDATKRSLFLRTSTGQAFERA